MPLKKVCKNALPQVLGLLLFGPLQISQYKIIQNNVGKEWMSNTFEESRTEHYVRNGRLYS